MKKYFVYILTLLLGLTACEDNTGAIGGSIVPEQDVITINDSVYWATSKSVAVDSVLGQTNKVYLGRFTDPQTGTLFEADFIAQFNCEEGGQIFPSGMTEEDIVKVELRLFFTNYFGDPTNTMTAEVYALSNTLQEGEKYYTNLDPAEFYNPDSLIATRVYTATDYSLEDSELEDSEHYANVNIPLPTKIGTEIFRKYLEDKDYFANATNFIENVCSGLYVKTAAGNGTVLYIDQATLNIHFRDTKSDSIFVTQFAGSEEVLQSNRFNTKKETVAPLIADDSWTYLKTPAGIFTEVELPIDEIINANNDSINAAKIAFACYNNEESDYPFGTPQTLLMIHKDEMYSFFEKNKLTDNISSFYTTHNSTYNNYEYSNIARLIPYCASKKGKSENWNKVVLIPVTTIEDSNKNIMNFRHDFSLNSVRLVGGKDKIKIRVITSGFN